MSKNKKITRIIAASLATISVVQVADIQSLSATEISDLNFSNSLSNTTWVVLQGTEKPYHSMVGRSGSDGKILRDINNPLFASANYDFCVDDPSDWNSIDSSITLKDYDKDKLGYQSTTLSYTSPSGEVISLQANFVVVKLQNNPVVKRDIYDKAKGSGISSSVFTNKENQYILKGIENVEFLDVYQQVSDTYTRNGKTYATLTMKSMNDITGVFGNTFEIEIVDNYPPIITAPSYVAAVPTDYVVSNLNSYFKATAYDYEDGDLTSKISIGDVTYIDKSNTGKKSVPLYVYDKQGLSDEEVVTFSVVSIADSYTTDKPVNDLVPSEFIDGLDDSFVVSVVDLGNDKVHATVTDKLGNVIEKDVTLIRSNESPVITAPTSVVAIPLNAVDSIVKKNINATALDKEDGDLTSDIIYGTLNTTTIGSKLVNLSVTDSKNANTTKDVKVSVVDIKDSIETNKNISDLTPNDLVDGLDPSFEVDIVDNHNGTVTVTVTDDTGNKITDDTKIIRPNTAPIISLKGTDTVLIPVNASAPLIKSNIGATASDKEDGDLTPSIEYQNISTVTGGAITVDLTVKDSGKLTDEKKVNASIVSINDVLTTSKLPSELKNDDVKGIIIGLDSSFSIKLVPNDSNSTVNVTVKDTYGNETLKNVKIRNDKNAPIITVTGNTVLIPINASSDTIKSNIKATAYDKEDGDLTAKISYDSVDTTVVEKKDVPLSVQDSDNNKDSKVAHIAVTTVADELISNKKTSDITPSDVANLIQGGDSSFKVDVTKKDDSTVTVEVTDLNGNSISEDVKVKASYTIGFTIEKGNSLLERDLPNPTSTIISQTKAVCLDKDGSSLPITVSGLDVTKIGTEQTVILNAIGTDGTVYHKEIKVNVVDILSSVTANSSGTISIATSSLVEGELSGYALTPIGTNTYNANSYIDVSVTDTYGNTVRGNVYVNKQPVVISDSSAYLTTSKNNALIEKDDKDFSKTILNQVGVSAFGKSGSALSITVLGFDSAKLGVTQTITLKAVDSNGSVLTKDIYVVVVDIYSSIKDTDGDGFVSVNGVELVDGELSSHVVTPITKESYKVDSYIPVTVTDSYGNKVSASVYVEKAELKPSFLANKNIALVEKNDSDPIKTVLEQSGLIAKDGTGNKLDITTNSSLDMKKIGQVQSIKFKAIDKYNQVATYTIKVVVVDIVESIHVPYGTDLSTVNINDLVNGESKDMKLSDTIKDSNINVVVTDREGNSVEDTVKVIFDNSAPVITSDKSIRVDLNTSTKDLLSALKASAYDSEDGDLTKSIKVTGYDKASPTEQTVTLSVTDSMGATTTKDITVIVSEKQETLPQTGDTANPLSTEMQFGLLSALTGIVAAITLKKTKKDERRNDSR